MPSSLRLTDRRTLLVLVDLALVNLTTLFALWVQATRGNDSFGPSYLLLHLEWFFLLSALWLLSAFLSGLYDQRKIADFSSSSASLLGAIALMVAAYLVIYFVLGSKDRLPRGLVLYQGVTGLVLIGVWRSLYAMLVQRAAFAHQVIIVGAGWAGQTIAEAIHRYAQSQYQIAGFVDDDPTKQGMSITLSQKVSGRRSASPTPAMLSVLGTSGDLAHLIEQHGVREIVLAVTRDMSTSLFKALMICKEQGAQITLMPVLFEQLTGQVPIEHIGDNWNVALPLDSAEAGGLYPVAKRVFDLVGALIGLTFFLPMLPFIALAIRLDSPGPILYAQERIGKGGKPFKLTKLRTMVSDAERWGQAMRAQRNDPRITRVGRLLRKMRLDEMPQLFSVLKGDMSAVGPRPERPEHLSELDQVIPFHRLRNAVKPGMAGWAVINHGYVDSVEDARIRLQYDLYYIKNQSLWLDFVILLRTMGQMFLLKGR